MSSTPDSIRSSPPWRQKLAAFGRWWADELSRLLPERMPFLMRGARVPVLAIADGEVVLVEPRSAAGPEARVAVATLGGQGRAAVRALLERVGEVRNRARLCLGRDEMLVRRVSMPAATEENLSQVIAFEMDRLTPFRADEVYYDQRVVARDAAAATVQVQLAVARREIVDARLATLRDLGVSVQGVVVPEDAPSPGARLDLLPSGQRGERETANERATRNVVLGAVLVLLFVAMLLPAWQKREAIIALKPVVDKAKQEATATDAIARTLERQVADYNYVQSKKHAAPALAYLEEVSRLLPDNTWVQQFELKNAGKSREVQVTGETTSSSKLIEIFEQSTLLQNAAPRGSVIRGSQPGTERFVIAAEARPRPLPEARPAAEVAAIPPPPEPVIAQPAAPAAPAASADSGPPEPAAEPAAAPAAPATARVETVDPKRAEEQAQAQAAAKAAAAAARDRKEATRAERKALLDARRANADAARRKAVP
jgi:general secretion pathway protein L